MRWFSLKELLVLCTVWNVSQQMKDILENIHPSAENSYELNNFLQDVMKMKKSFKQIQNAAAELNEDDDFLTGGQMNEDIDEYIYDEENLEANRKTFNTENHQEVNSQMSHHHKDDRPSNDIYPHIYRGHADHEYKNFEQDNGIRFRRQLVDDVQVEPKSSKGNIRVQVLDGKFNLANKGFKSGSTPNDISGTLTAVITEVVKATVPIQEEIPMTSKATPEETDSPNLQTTQNGPGVGFPVANPHKLEEQPHSENLDRSGLPNDEKKKNYNIKILDDGKMVKDYTSMDKQKEISPENNLPTGSTRTFDIPPVSRGQNGFRPEIDKDKNDKNYDDGTSTDDYNCEKDESDEIPTMEPDTQNANEAKGNQPIFRGPTMDRMNKNYRPERPHNIRPHSYNNYDYSQRSYPSYSYEPEEKFYKVEYRSPYEENYRPQLQTFNIEDDQRDIVNYPANNEFYQLRRLQSTNESLHETSRKKRNIEEFLGLNNEDDYAEDLDFSTETIVKTKLLENEEQYIGERSSRKSTNGNTENLSKSSMKNIHTSAESSSTDPTTVTTAVSDLPIKYYTSPKTTITKNGRMKRARKYRNVRKRKKLTRMQNKFTPVAENNANIKSNRSYGQGDMMKNSNKKIHTFKKGEKISSKVKPDLSQYSKLTKRSYQTNNKDDQSYKVPLMSTDMNYYNQYSEYFKDPRFKETSAENRKIKDRLYQRSIGPSSNRIFFRPRYFHFVPFVPPNSFYQGKFLACVHFDPTNVGNRDQDNLSNQRNSLSPKKESWRTFNSRKLMTNSDDSKDEHKSLIKEDQSNGPKKIINKRTESDYGEEPDLSEGQPIKKHSKLKKYNKVDAPGKNFEDNYEFEEEPNGNSNSPELKEVQVQKHIEKNSKLEEDDQHSFKEKLTKLKNKLFSSNNDEIDKVIRDGRSYGANYEYSNRIDRQPKQAEQAPLSYEHEELLDPSIGLTSKSNFEPLRSAGPYYCPDNPSSQAPCANPTDSSTRSCKGHACRWHFNPLSGTFESTSCPCDPCDSNPCPWETSPPCNPCPYPTTCNTYPTFTASNDHEETYSPVKERSLNSNVNTNSPCACDPCPCPNPDPCPPPPCEPCPCPSPCPCPCPCGMSKEQEKLGQKEQNPRIQDSFDVHLGLVKARNAGSGTITKDNNDLVSNGEFSRPSSEQFTSNIPRIELRQYPRENMFVPNDVYKVFSFPETIKSDEINEEPYSPYDGSLNHNINIFPYPRYHQLYPYSLDSNYREYAIPRACPYPHISSEIGKIPICPSLTKRGDILDVQLPDMQIPYSSSSDNCPCVFGYFLPCPHLSSSSNLHPHSVHSAHVVSEADEVNHQSHNGVPWIDPEISPSAGDGFAQPQSYSARENFPSKESYLACRPSIPLKQIFSSQPDSINLHESPSGNPNAEDNNCQGYLNQETKNNKRSLSRRLNGLPYSFENINPNYPYAFQGQHYGKLHYFRPATYYQNPSIMSPTSPYISSSDLSVDKNRKEKRKCPKPSEPLPPCSGSPLPCPQQHTYTQNDNLAEKARRVNEFLKSKFLNGRYSMNNMMFPRSKRELTYLKNSQNSISENIAPVIRRVRRPHGVPRKPLNRKMPQQNNEKKERTKQVRNNEEGLQTESSIPYYINENDQFEEEDIYPSMHVDRKSRSFLNEETHHDELKSEQAKHVKKTNRIELQDLHFAKEIIDTVIEKVNKNPNLKIKIGNALNKKKIYEAESNQQHHTKDGSCKEQEEHDETKTLLRSVSCVLNKLVKKQIQEKLCEHLPGHLKTFLKHIVRPPKHRRKQRCNDKYHEDTFLFRASYPQNKLNVHCINQLEDNLVNLMNRFNQLDDESKNKAAPVQSYIANHLNMLKKIGEEHTKSKNSLIGHDNFMKENEHPSMNTMNEEKNIAFQNPVKFEGSSNTLDIMERDLENADLEKEQVSPEKVGSHNLAHTKADEEELETKLKKRDALDDNYKLHVEKKGVKEKNKIGKTKVSDKYKKLVEAAEEVRCKRKNEEKIGEAFGKKQVKGIEDSQAVQHVIR